jgi:hypothetical protein
VSEANAKFTAKKGGSTIFAFQIPEESKGCDFDNF